MPEDDILIFAQMPKKFRISLCSISQQILCAVLLLTKDASEKIQSRKFQKLLSQSTINTPRPITFSYSFYVVSKDVQCGSHLINYNDKELPEKLNKPNEVKLTHHSDYRTRRSSQIQRYKFINSFANGKSRKKNF
jgi:hypothetical protein